MNAIAAIAGKLRARRERKAAQAIAHCPWCPSPDRLMPLNANMGHCSCPVACGYSLCWPSSSRAGATR